MIDCNEWRAEKRHECANMGKVKRFELWWQLHHKSLPVWDLENFRPMDFCWHECTFQVLFLRKYDYIFFLGKNTFAGTTLPILTFRLRENLFRLTASRLTSKVSERPPHEVTSGDDYKHKHVWECMYVCMHARACIYIYIYIYIYILYIHIHSKVKVSRDRPRWPKGFRVG